MLDSLESQIRKLRSLFWSDRDQEGQAFVALAEAYRRSGDLDQALELLNEGLERHPQHTSGILVLGRVHRDRGDTSEARDAFERVVELDGENVEALRGLGEVAAAEGDMERARERFQKVLELDPDDPGAMTALGDLRTALDQAAAPHGGVPDDDAGIEEDVVETVVGFDEEPAEPSVIEAPMDAASAEGDGLVDWDEGAWESWSDESEEHSIDEAGEEPIAEVEEEPADEQEVYTRTMAEVYASQGHHSRAIEVLEHILERNPDDEAIQARLEVLRDSIGTQDAGPSESQEGEVEGEVEAVDESRLEELAEEMAFRHEDEPIDTPFAWATDEPEAEPAGAVGPTAREYFASLLEWRPTPIAEPAATSEPPVVPVADLGPDGVEEGPYDHLPLVPIQDLAPDPVSADPTDRPNS